MLPLLPLLSLWRWFCIDWVNLTGDRALVVLVTARVLNMAVAAPLLDLLAEAVGQSLIRNCQRSAEGTLVLVRRKGAGQLLTIIRVIGLAAAVTVWVQGAPSLGLTSITILAMSSVPALAISLGTQQLIRNISDGFSLFLDGQPKVGDQCSIGTPKARRWLICRAGPRPCSRRQKTWPGLRPTSTMATVAGGSMGKGAGRPN